jgi:hypothetical protein
VHLQRQPRPQLVAARRRARRSSQVAAHLPRCLRGVCATSAEGEYRRSPEAGCTRDGGRSSGAALQEEAPNHRGLRWLNGQRGERCGKGVDHGVRYESGRRTTVNRRGSVEKNLDDVRTEDVPLPREKSGRSLRTAQTASGIKAARARLRLSCGTWEPAIPMLKGEAQAAGTARGRVPMRDAGTDRLVVAMKPGNAGGAKEAGYPGSLGGQPQGRNR